MILHILLKDLRRHWREISLFVLVCGAWTWQQSNPGGWLWVHQRQLVPVLLFLLFGLWFFITVRVVHGESLVGDKEFWTTRPYRWGNLLAAKAILLALCLNGPLLAAQIVLLLHAGIPFSFSLLPGLIFLQLEFAFFLTFPAAALAALTESFVQWILAIAGIILFAVMMSSLPWGKMEAPLAGGETVDSLLAGALIVLALAFAILWQYARRRVWPPRLALGGAIMAVPLFIWLASTPLIRSIAYPRSTGESPFRLSILNTGDKGEREYTRHNDFFSDADIGIPIVADSLEPDTIINVDGYRVTLNGDNGWHWQSPWLNQSLTLSYDDAGGTIFFNLPGSLANQLQQVHATASVELAFGVRHLGPAQRVETGAQRFTVPGIGFCRWPDANEETYSRSPFECVAPLRLPGVWTSRIESADVTCPQEEGELPLPAGHHASVTNYGTDEIPADFDPNPVRSFDLNMGNWVPAIPSARDSKEARSAVICRGTPITIRTGSLVGTKRAIFDLGNMGNEKLILKDPDGTVRFGPDSE